MPIARVKQTKVDSVPTYSGQQNHILIPQVATRSTACEVTTNDRADQHPSEGELKIQAEIISSIDQVSQSEWDECANGSEEMNPFLLWSFLNALEVSRSAVKEEGWLPQHILLRSAETNQLLACIPLYLKGHSYGEYVFDNSWAVLASRLGQRYYPKFQAAVPFTPVTGPRVLVRDGSLRKVMTKAAAQTLMQLTDEYNISGAHITFNLSEEGDAFSELGFLRRTGIQYHWVNKNYDSFDSFLMDLKQSKRNNIRKERRSIAKEGLSLHRLTGSEIKSQHWDAFYKFYINTTDRKWGQAYLTREFFQVLGETMPEQVLLVMAEDGSGRPMAGALNLIGSHALFGRNWGCAHGDEIKHLHFEVCYYQALEAAIERGLARVEAGAQGEHKLQRGYLPSLTHSSHYISNPLLRSAIGNFLAQERQQIDYTMEALLQHVSPYRSIDA
ncbi:g1722 [Coccomyxa elongata]